MASRGLPHSRARDAREQASRSRSGNSTPAASGVWSQRAASLRTMADAQVVRCGRALSKSSAARAPHQQAALAAAEDNILRSSQSIIIAVPAGRRHFVPSSTGPQLDAVRVRQRRDNARRSSPGRGDGGPFFFPARRSPSSSSAPPAWRAPRRRRLRVPNRLAPVLAVVAALSARPKPQEMLHRPPCCATWQ